MTEPIEPRIPTDAELEALLDEESDLEFGESEVQAASAEPRAVLKEWSAQDFANIYTRFRPHLERHARRFLRNPSQVDEVVQDAFLYLMVTLPELDSELGVLRFLKWKVRLLCLDVIRAQSRAQISDIDAHPEFESSDPEVGSIVEQAEDAAIVRLALSKLNPRHREVLLASMYEEKSTREIAEQVGLSENATLQLLHRARAAFKKALIGEVETAGMTLSQILSVAARKAAADAKNVGAKAMVFVLFLMLGLGSVLTFTRNNDTNNIAEAPAPAASQSAAPADSSNSNSAAATETTEATTNDATQPVIQTIAASVSNVVAIPDSAPSPSASPFDVKDLVQVFDNSVQSDYLVLAKNGNSFDALPYVVESSNGLIADFIFDADDLHPFQNLTLTIQLEKKTYNVYGRKSDYVVARDSKGLDHYVYFGEASHVQDAKTGDVYTDSEISNGEIRLELIVDPNVAQVVGSSLTFVYK
ncbi:RNA polymerase sigma factor [Candidatus Rhodoluna planktonica]|uniref:RNA polymerase sigma factor 70 region 4 type 2 domain-containing protein n=1 Tax=Candidatus Rhodoluna planktonica TaxID=535712 RepID=A0A1D9E0H2_9MICO|nr:sigma-70 family RNA polymerase sigma factor [Candidatus Rhodoluna planktonica]AOY56541.1 hypothetical protein A4Z71_06245 [Candidatus Rhodoluna planktonica]